MRQTVDTFLAGTAVLYSPATVSDGQGGYVQSYAASGTVVARVAAAVQDQFGGQEMNIGAKYSEVGSRVATLPYNTSVATTDRLVYAGVTYEVVEVYDRTPETLNLRVRLRSVSAA